MAVLWNPRGQNVILKENMTIGYVKILDYKEKDPPRTTKKLGKNHYNTAPKTSTVTVREVIEISHEKFLSMPEQLAFIFHHNFYPKPKVNLEDAEITLKIKQKSTDPSKNMTMLSVSTVVT